MSGKDDYNEFDALFGRFFNNQQDNDKGIGAFVAPSLSNLQRPVNPYLSKTGPQKSRSSSQNGYPTLVLNNLSHYVQLQSDPKDVIAHAQHFLEAENCREMEACLGKSTDYASPIVSDVNAGKIRGYYFEESKYCEFSLNVGHSESQLYLEGRRLDGCAFVFTNVWNSMVQSLSEAGLVESEDDDDMTMGDYLDELFDSDSEDMDIEEMCQMDLGGCPETVQTMIDELSDINYQETYASKLAYNCRNEQNKEAIMEHSQQLFDTIIESIMCNITLAYFISSQLPLYRSLAVLLNTIFETQLDSLDITTEQFEVLVAATKKWGLPAQSQDGPITNCEQIAGLLSEQLSRCVPHSVSQKAQEDLQTLQSDSPYACVQMNISDALMAC